MQTDVPDPQEESPRKDESPLNTFPCAVGGNMGKIYIYSDRFRFATSEDENPTMALEASWSMLEVVKSQNTDVLVLEVAHQARWYFDNVDNQSSIFSVIDNYTGRNKTSLYGKGSLPSFGTASTSPMLQELYSLDAQEEEVLPSSAAQMMSEDFPIELRHLLGLMFGEEFEFFQNLHSRRDSRIEYGQWVAGQGYFIRQVNFNTTQAPITVEVTQTQKLYRSGGKFCFDVENNFKGFPGSGRLSVYAYHRFTDPEGEEETDENEVQQKTSHVEIFTHVEVGKVFLGKGHAVREALEDVHEYCARFRSRVQAAILAGVDDSGSGTLKRLEETKPQLVRLREYTVQNVAVRGELALAKIVLLAIILFQVIALIHVILS